MNKSRSENTTPQPIQAEDALRSLTAGVGQLDGDRAAAYGELSTLRSAKQSSLERREKIYALKYGANDRHVLQVRKQREINTRLRQEIYLAHVQAATPAPTVDENGYVFHGFVRNRARRPLPRLTVALYDQEGQWLRELGYGCTDEKGYFILRYTRSAKEVAAERKKAAAEQAAAEKEREKARAAGEEPVQEIAQPSRSAQPAGAEVLPKIQSAPRAEPADRETRSGTAEIRVYNAEQKLVHREARPLTPKLGSIDYREITIDDGERCVPPPGSPDDPPPPAPAKMRRDPRAPAPTAPQPPPAPAPVRPTEPTVQPEAAAPRQRFSTPLENIKGVGPKTAAKLRASGIKDVEALERTDPKKLVALAGTDKKITAPTPKPARSRTSPAKKKKRPRR